MLQIILKIKKKIENLQNNKETIKEYDLQTTGGEKLSYFGFFI